MKGLTVRSKQWWPCMSVTIINIGTSSYKSSGLLLILPLNLKRSLRGHMDVPLQPCDISPDGSCYDKLTELNHMREYIEKEEGQSLDFEVEVDF